MGQIWLPLACSLVVSLDSMPEFDYANEASVEWLHVFLLNISIRHLKDGRVGRAEYEDCLKWVDGEPEAPFSFDACCRVAGFNAEDLRANIKRIVKANKKENVGERQTRDEGNPGVLPEAGGSLQPVLRYSNRAKARTGHGLR